MVYNVKILEIKEVTHDVKSFKLEKPEGYSFVPGQATDVSINLEGYVDKKRPFTFTCLNTDPYLEFTIKIYSDHDGVTKKLGELKEGDELIIDDPFGAISYKGPGVFIAGGAGITPFIAIIRQLNKNGGLKGNTLIFSNKSEKDIILRYELDSYVDLEKVYTLTREKVDGLEHGRINADFIKKYVKDFKQHFYVCGPIRMVGEIQSLLRDLGADSDSIVLES